MDEREGGAERLIAGSLMWAPRSTIWIILFGQTWRSEPPARPSSPFQRVTVAFAVISRLSCQVTKCSTDVGEAGSRWTTVTGWPKAG
jgi:hypothetical protein